MGRQPEHKKQPHDRPIATQFPGHRCMDNLKTERRFYSQAKWAMLSMAFVQPGIDIRPVDWCTNYVSALQNTLRFPSNNNLCYPLFCKQQ